MKQLVRDLYTRGRVWLSLTHNFESRSTADAPLVDLVKFNNGYLTLNAEALFQLTFWGEGSKPGKFWIPEFKIHELQSILETLYSLKSDPRYVIDGKTLTQEGKPSNLYYRMQQANKRYIDFYFVEFEYNGEKAINIAIEHESKSYSLYDNEVLKLINIIPTDAEIVKYKQSAAELYFMMNHLGMKVGSQEEKTPPINQVTRPPRQAPSVPPSTNRPRVTPPVQPESEPEEPIYDMPDDEEVYEAPLQEPKPETNPPAKPTGGTDYSSLLEDE